MSLYFGNIQEDGTIIGNLELNGLSIIPNKNPAVTPVLYELRFSLTNYSNIQKYAQLVIYNVSCSECDISVQYYSQTDGYIESGQTKDVSINVGITASNFDTAPPLDYAYPYFYYRVYDYYPTPILIREDFDNSIIKGT